MSNGMKIQDAILKAIDTLTSSRIDQIQADKTVVAIISKCTNALKREYRLSYNGGTIIAYAQEGQTYTIGQEVYVLVPEGDFTKKKLIVGISQAQEDDSNITFVASALSDYNVIGRNVIRDNNKVTPSGLHSYLHEEYKILYSHDDLEKTVTINGTQKTETVKIPKTEQLDINIDELNNNLKEAEAVLMEASFCTTLPKEHRTSKTGSYGLEFVLAFADRDNIGEDGTPATKYYSYVIDTNNMTGNPFRFSTYAEQYQIYPIDLENFLYIDSIVFFESNFVQEDNQLLASDPPMGFGPDIFVKDIEFYGLKHITAQNGIYKLRITMPEGNTLRGITNQQHVKIRGRLSADNLDLSDQTNYYWFKEDNRVYYGQEGYQAYGGKGWRHLEKEKDKDFVTYGNDNRAYENKYKLVVVYQESMILKEEFTIYNEASKRDLAITSSLGAKFSFDRGKPELTCTIDGKSADFEDINDTRKVYHPDEYYSFIWSKEDPSVGTTIFNETQDEVKKRYNEAMASGNFSYSDLSAMRSLINNLEGVNWTRNVLSYPVRGVENSATFKCSVYLKDTKDGESYGIGSATITLQNEAAATPDDYYIVIENGDQVFQYSESGVAPNDERYANPLEVKPLICHFFDPAGLEVNNKTYSVKWKVPLENTMIVTPSSGMEINYATNKKEWCVSEVYPLNGWKNGEDTVSGIADNYDYFALDNQVQCIVTYKDREYTQYSNLTFTKVGENGTNGTDIVGKISPTYTRSDGTLLALELDRTKPKGYQAEFNSGQTISQQVLDFNLFQRNEKLAIESTDVSWSISGGNAKNSNSKYLSVDGGIVSYSEDKEETGKFRNQIIRASLRWETNDYYAFYPLPIIEYNFGKTYPVTIDDKDTLKYVTYNADGHYPIYNKNQGVTLHIGENDDLDKYVVWSVEGGMPSRKTFTHDDGTSVYGYELHPTNEPDIRIIRHKNSKNGQLQMVPTQVVLSNGEYVESLQKDIDEVFDDEFTADTEKLSKIDKIVQKYQESVQTEIDEENTKKAVKDEYPKITYQTETMKKVYVLPNDAYSGECCNNFVVAKIYDSETTFRNGNTPEVVVYMPIYMSLNTYGLKSLNAWDGNHVEINEDENYILAPQIGAGMKDKDNHFTGVVMGKATFYDLSSRASDGTINDTTKQGNLEPVDSLGLIGYSKGKQSIFLNAEDGSATFGLPEDNNLQGEGGTNSKGLPKYNEGRIKLVPGGTSSIGNWKIGSRILYNLVKDARTTNDLKGDTKLDGPYEGMNKENDGTRGRYKTSIPHDAEGIMLSAEPSYISIKGRMFNNSLDIKNEADYTDSNVIVQPFDSFELQLDPNDASLFTVYRHSMVPEDTMYQIDSNGDIRLVMGEINRSNNGLSPEIYTKAVKDSSGRIIGWKPIRPAVQNMGGTSSNRYRPITDNGKSTYVIARPYLISNNNGNPVYSDFMSDNRYFFMLVNAQTPGNGRDCYYIPEVVSDSKQANVDIFKHPYWHREAVVGINNQGRFYTNALKDGMTSLSVGALGAFGYDRRAKLYGGAAFEIGSDKSAFKLAKFFTDFDDINKRNGHLYMSGGTSLNNEYERDMSAHFKTIELHTLQTASTSKHPNRGARFYMNDKDIQLQMIEPGQETDFSQNYFVLRRDDVTKPGLQAIYGTELHTEGSSLQVYTGNNHGIVVRSGKDYLEATKNDRYTYTTGKHYFIVGKDQELGANYNGTTNGCLTPKGFLLQQTGTGGTVNAYIHGTSSVLDLSCPFVSSVSTESAHSSLHLPSTGEARLDAQNIALSAKTGYIHTGAPHETICYVGQTSMLTLTNQSTETAGSMMFKLNADTSGVVQSTCDINGQIGVKITPLVGTPALRAYGTAGWGGSAGNDSTGLTSIYADGDIYTGGKVLASGNIDSNGQVNAKGWIWSMSNDVKGNDFKFNQGHYGHSAYKFYTSQSARETFEHIIDWLGEAYNTLKSYWNQSDIVYTKIQDLENKLNKLQTDVTTALDTANKALDTANTKASMADVEAKGYVTADHKHTYKWPLATQESGSPSHSHSISENRAMDQDTSTAH